MKHSYFRSFILLAFLLSVIGGLYISADAQNQYPSMPPYRGRRSSAPATCVADRGEWYYNTTTDKFQYCSATNTWSDLGGASGITVGSTASNGTSNTLLKTNASAQVADATGITNPSSGVIAASSRFEVPDNVGFDAVGLSSGNAGIRMTTGQIIFTTGGARYGQFYQYVGHSVKSDLQYTWSSGSDVYLNGQDTGLARAAAKVIKLTDGSTGNATLSSVPLSPTALSANTDNYNPGTTRHLRISATTPVNLTGIVAGVDGQELFIWNVGATNTITITHQTVSTAANQFFTTTGANIALAAGKCAIAMYDGTTARWRVSLLP